MDACIKEEPHDISNVNSDSRPKIRVASTIPDTVIELSSSDSDSEVDLDNLISSTIASSLSRGETASVSKHGAISKNSKTDAGGVDLTLGFLSPLPPPEMTSGLQVLPSTSLHANENGDLNARSITQSSKQFWKAGDYEGATSDGWESSSAGMDHVRVHPKFLHSNATSHKWALGAFAELLDNSLDEVCNGATYVNVDMVLNKKDCTRMLLIEDNGGGMDPDKMRRCMSLGYSVKSKLANTIGQYGNGFKTSTMRLGADVIVFSRHQGEDGKSSTQSIGLLSYTFLRCTGKEDIVVPMLDYERGGQGWNRMIRSSCDNWSNNVDTIVRWSPFSSEEDLLRQFNLMKDHGTRIIIYNLWEDDQGQLELDFDADPHDIQIRGVNREEKHIQMADKFPNSRHFLTYRHSLRSYASILYLRLPPGFRIILRGKDVVHHNIVNDMMMSQEVTYRPQAALDGAPSLNIVAVVTIGFVKDAVHHIDVSGFNVYHKNRLIKPFWKIWNPAGSGGRGVIGVLEANFVEPAHDKQGFERTIVLSRLEQRLVQMQKNYWNSNRQRIGYAPNPIYNPRAERADRETSPDPDHSPVSNQLKRKYSASSSKATPIEEQKKSKRSVKKKSLYEPAVPEEEASDEDHVVRPKKRANEYKQKTFQAEKSSDDEDNFLQDIASNGRTSKSRRGSKPNGKDAIEGHCPISDLDQCALEQLKEENRDLKERLSRMEEEIGEVRRDLQHERDKCKSLEIQLDKKIEESNKEQETIIDVFTEERERRDAEEKKLRKKLQEASATIEELRDKVRLQEKRLSSGKQGR
ncbi:hypothetical protein K1719_038308 [Acacia pycnantha]|nr:hypothetical protein K1719_038308 [Acacia pycnantha]